MIKLLVTDLDGTLLDNDGVVSMPNRSAIALLEAIGIPTIAATARSPRSTRQISAIAGLGPMAVCANGAIVCNLETSVVIRHDLISRELSQMVITTLRRKLRDVILAGEYLEEFYAESGFFKRRVPGLEVPEIERLEDYIEPGLTKIIARVPAITSEALRDQLSPCLSPFVDVTISGPDWIEFAAHGVSKASGLAHVCELMGIDPTEVAAIGDQRNDLTMLAFVGYPFTLRNAHPDLFKLTNAIVGENTRSGFAEIVPRIRALLESNITNI